MMTPEDLQSWCDDLSAWIKELGEEEEFKTAYPKGTLPLVVDLADIEDNKDILAYLIVWMCCKRKMRAPPHLESRMVLAERFKGPWQGIYSKLVQRLERGLAFTDIFDLAG